MKNNSVDIVYKKECTGCSVCYHACPHNAIEMIETKEGFHYPVVLEEKCTDCGLCVKKCHALNDNFKTDFKQQIYDVRANDEIRMKSSSGGMFTLLADYVFENNGYVCGASFTDDWLGVEHIIINDKKDLYKLRGSKYIESNLGNTFIEIKKLLNEKKQVLFTGCPCQVSALYSYLGKDYDNLLTVDLLCNSIVPQKVWVKYLKELFTDEKIKEIEYISFRNKEKFGWNSDHKIYIKFKYGEYLVKGFDSIYIKSFLTHVSVKEECLHCKYRKYERAGDISIGDYWGVKDNDNKGVSLVLINTDKGNNAFNKIKKYCKHKDVTKLKPSNGGINGKTIIFGSRKYFFHNFDKESFNELVINSNKIDICLIGFWFANNYGAILTYYALYKLLENLGFSISVLDSLDKDSSYYDYHSKGIAREFAEKYYFSIFNNINKEDLYELNNKCNMFITASDQLWNNEIKTSYHTKYIYFLDFIDNKKKKIAISTSFGDNITNLADDINSKSRIFVNHYLDQFDHISLRESSAVDFFKKELNLDADFILDPVFLADMEEYYNLINTVKEECTEENYIFAYLYGLNSHIEEIKNIANKMNKKLICSNFKETPEQWLLFIKNASFVITDGFHGSCFSIIFNKPFVCVRSDYYSNNLFRIMDLLSLLNLKERVIPNLSILENNLEKYLKIDYDEINKKINIEKNRSLEWIKNAIFSPKVIKNDIHKENLLNLLISKNIELDNENKRLNNEIKENKNWIRFFGIYNNKNYIYIYIFGIKCVIKATEKNINRIAWWIPVRKWREAFRDKF
ncbi:polysaccharide pyruvyl transferase family protein [uncultured Brachyspira sp.]|uniref:polysaccharide pyruvyl transferase family protein n=1 Tax=uncultured Brachyspira sp. TaxID=221953 RepID=UPI002634ED02|nr:polysaccharide pyruvyl transferase family protein [uncultured Brachyspira sp.]